MDEASLNANYPLRACWMRRGQQKRLPTAARNRHEVCRLMGAYNWGSDTVHLKRLFALNSTCFVLFIEWLLTQCYPHEVVVLVMDNVSYHHAAQVQAALSVFEHRLIVLWLPPYCPELNLIERYWRHLKDRVYANTLWLDANALTERVQQHVAFQNDPLSPHRLLFSKDFQ